MRRLVGGFFLSVALLFAAGQSFGQLALTGAGSFKATSSGRTCTDGTTSANFLARTSGLNNAHQDAYCVLLNGLDTDSIIPVLDVLYIFATADTSTAKLNLISTSCTATGSPATFTVDAGFTPTDLGTDYLNDNCDNSTLTNFTRNGALLGGWSNTSAVDVVGMVGSAVDDATTHIYPRFTGDKFVFDVNTSDTSYTTSATNTDGKGFYTAERTTGILVTGYKNGASIGTGSTSSAPIPAQNMLFGGAAANSSGQQIMAGVIGANIGSTPQANLCARIGTYLHTINGLTSPC